MDNETKKTLDGVTIIKTEKPEGFEIGSRVECVHRGHLSNLVAERVWADAQNYDYDDLFDLVKRVRKQVS